MSLIAADKVVLSVREEGGATRPLAGLRRHALHLTQPTTEHGGTGQWARRSASQSHASAAVRAEGVFVSSEAQALVRTAFLSGDTPVLELSQPGEGVWVAAFLIRQLTFWGESEGELSFSLRLASTGPVRFTPV
ncbi:phage tail tube protein [Parvularcula maris]|uniref:Phage tail tube protein n=1 Tax=Parvularcula maris TaxID=2965077 RepID=A0A9X2L710_9PROT|nr:phage tail tube protein [Parvularcula maris]MCQ8184240.1 phage tail tube protein [Parvularcula maris]